MLGNRKPWQSWENNPYPQFSFSLKVRFSPDSSQIFFFWRLPSCDSSSLAPVGRIPLNLHPGISHGLGLHSRLRRLPSLSIFLRPFYEWIPNWKLGLLCPLSQSKQGWWGVGIKYAIWWDFLNTDKWRVSFAFSRDPRGRSQPPPVAARFPRWLPREVVGRRRPMWCVLEIV